MLRRRVVTRGFDPSDTSGAIHRGDGAEISTPVLIEVQTGGLRARRTLQVARLRYIIIACSAKNRTQSLKKWPRSLRCRLTSRPWFAKWMESLSQPHEMNRSADIRWDMSARFKPLPGQRGVSTNPILLRRLDGRFINFLMTLMISLIAPSWVSRCCSSSSNLAASSLFAASI